ncbi:MAG: hypothetical protein AAF871_08420 [Pseudomonadota bacterium]
MNPLGPTGAAQPLRLSGDGNDLPQQPQYGGSNAASGAPVSAAASEAKQAANPETAQAVDAPVQAVAAQRTPADLPRSPEKAPARLEEPTRLAASSIAASAPEAGRDAPAGPPPAFKISILEKALTEAQQAGRLEDRAVQAEPQTEALDAAKPERGAAPAPERGPGTDRSSDEGPAAARSETRTEPKEAPPIKEAPEPVFSEAEPVLQPDPTGRGPALAPPVPGASE